MFNFGTQELILVLIIALVVFGPGKLPEVGKAIGKSLNEFKGAMNGDKGQKEIKEMKDSIEKSVKVEDVKITPFTKGEDKHVEDAFKKKGE